MSNQQLLFALCGKYQHQPKPFELKITWTNLDLSLLVSPFCRHGLCKFFRACQIIFNFICEILDIYNLNIMRWSHWASPYRASSPSACVMNGSLSAAARKLSKASADWPSGRWIVFQPVIHICKQNLRLSLETKCGFERLAKEKHLVIVHQSLR